MTVMKLIAQPMRDYVEMLEEAIRLEDSEQVLEILDLMYLHLRLKNIRW